MSPAEIAKVCHEINRAYCHAIGDDSQLSWDQAPEWQRQSAIHGVEFSLAHPTGTPVEIKLVRHYDPVKRDRMVAMYKSEAHEIDSALEVINAVTDLIEEKAA